MSQPSRRGDFFATNEEIAHSIAAKDSITMLKARSSDVFLGDGLVGGQGVSALNCIATFWASSAVWPQIR